MTMGELAELLRSTGYPVAYSHFSGPQAAPYICYMATNSDNFDADNQVYYPVRGVRVELYTDQKDPAAEAKVEDALSGLPWESYETYIDTEHLYQIGFEIEV